MIEHILELIAPHQCIGCSQSGTLLCSQCDEAVTRAPKICHRCGKQLHDALICSVCRRNSSLETFYAAATYEGLAKELVQRLKFGRAAAAAEPMARLMAEGIERRSGMLVVPVPTASSRIRIRGYDQSAKIAQRLARRLDLPYAPLLRRTGQQRQVGSDRLVRQKQMQNAFELRGKHQHEHKSILLVDDVLTTGSTMEAAARILQQNGFTDIRVAVFAMAE